MDTITLRNKLNNLHGIVNNSSLYKYSSLLDNIEYNIKNNINIYDTYKNLDKLNKKFQIKINKTHHILDTKIKYYLDELNINKDDIVSKLEIYNTVKKNSLNLQGGTLNTSYLSEMYTSKDLEKIPKLIDEISAKISNDSKAKLVETDGKIPIRKLHELLIISSMLKKYREYPPEYIFQCSYNYFLNIDRLEETVLKYNVEECCDIYIRLCLIFKCNGDNNSFAYSFTLKLFGRSDIDLKTKMTYIPTETLKNIQLIREITSSDIIIKVIDKCLDKLKSIEHNKYNLDLVIKIILDMNKKQPMNDKQLETLSYALGEFNDMTGDYNLYENYNNVLKNILTNEDSSYNIRNLLDKKILKISTLGLSKIDEFNKKLSNLDMSIKKKYNQIIAARDSLQNNQSKGKNTAEDSKKITSLGYEQNSLETERREFIYKNRILIKAIDKIDRNIFNNIPSDLVYK